MSYDWPQSTTYGLKSWLDIFSTVQSTWDQSGVQDGHTVMCSDNHTVLSYHDGFWRGNGIIQMISHAGILNCLPGDFCVLDTSGDNLIFEVSQGLVVPAANTLSLGVILNPASNGEELTVATMGVWPIKCTGTMTAGFHFKPSLTVDWAIVAERGSVPSNRIGTCGKIVDETNFPMPIDNDPENDTTGALCLIWGTAIKSI